MNQTIVACGVKYRVSGLNDYYTVTKLSTSETISGIYYRDLVAAYNDLDAGLEFADIKERVKARHQLRLNSKV